MGVIALVSSLLILLVLPLSGRSNLLTRSSYFYPIRRAFFWLFVGNFILLGWLGTQAVEPASVLIGQISSTIYAGYFIFALLD